MERSALVGAAQDRAILILLAAIALIAGLVPLGVAAGAWPGPDLVYVLLVAWTLRRPGGLDLLTLMALSLLADLVRGGPLGLSTLALIGIREFLLRAGEDLRRGPFPVEWAVVTVLFAALIVLQCVGLWLAFSPRPPLWMLAVHVLLTGLAYPPAAALARLAPPGRVAR